MEEEETKRLEMDIVVSSEKRTATTKTWSSVNLDSEKHHLVVNTKRT